MKKIIFKTFIFLLIAVLLLTAGGLWYAQKVFLPKKLKPFVIDAAQKYAKLKIDFDAVAYDFPGKFSFTNMVVFEKNIPSQKTFWTKEAVVRFKLTPLLLKKQIFIEKIELKALHIYPGPGRSFTSIGDMALEGEFSYVIGNLRSIVYNGVLSLKNQDIKNMPFVKNVADLNGRIKIEPNKISILELTGTSFGCPVAFSGWLENFRDPYMNLTETIDLDMSKTGNFLSRKMNESLKNISLSGKSSVILNSYGKFSEWPLKFAGTASVTNGQANIKQLANPISSINGSVNFDDKSITIPEIKAIYNSVEYTLKANVTDFNAPSVSAVLLSQDMTLEVKLETTDDYIKFNSVNYEWFNSNLNLVGELQNFQDPQLKLTGDAKIDLQDLQKILAKLMQKDNKTLAFINDLNPKGVCAVSIFMDSNIKDIKNCELGLKASSENIILKGFNLGALDLAAQLKERNLLIPRFDLSPYGGKLKIHGQVYPVRESNQLKSAAFSKGVYFAPKNNAPSPAYNIDIKAVDIDLEKMTKDTGLKDKNIRGALSLNTALNGAGADTNNLNGTGWILISNGHLWEFPLLGKIAETLRMPGLTKIEIQESKGNFTIMNRKIATENLQFFSPQMNMLAKGNLGFDTTLDFNIGLTFAPDFAEKNQLTKLAMMLIDQTGRLMGEVSLEGTIKEPKYSFVTMHLDKIKDNVISGFKKIFKQ